MPKLSLNDIDIPCNSSQSLFDLMAATSTPLASSCKKQGKCKECLVEIKSGEEFLSEISEVEKKLTHGYRLSCQTFIKKEGKVEVKTLKRPEIKIEERGRVLNNDLEINPTITRVGSIVFLDDDFIAESTKPLLGLIVDIGTTTVVVRLIDVEDGTIKASASFENPQRYAGSNVMSRIAYDTEFGKKELKRVFTTYLSKTILSICEFPGTIYEVVIGGIPPCEIFSLG